MAFKKFQLSEGNNNEEWVFLYQVATTSNLVKICLFTSCQFLVKPPTHLNNVETRFLTMTQSIHAESLQLMFLTTKHFSQSETIIFDRDTYRHVLKITVLATYLITDMRRP
jgi:hypothetical protein